MTNEKHTPGCEGDRYGCPRCKPDKWGILNETDCGCIAETLSDGEVVVHHCHEHAAAPDLLAALEMTLEMIAKTADTAHESGHTEAEVIAGNWDVLGPSLRAALAKARGSA